VQFVSGYPGCPSAEIGDEFGKIASKHGIYAEWATNEKVALESAIGASFSGVKALVNMKSFGINVCSDSLLPLAYTGTKAPMVIIVADDPSCHSSAQTEQDSRAYAQMAHIPMIEPSDPQECYDFTKLAFEISEKFNMPIILRTTTRVAHQRAVVEFEERTQETSQKISAEFVKNKSQFVTMPPRVMEMKKELLEKIKKIQAYAEKSRLNKESKKDPVKKSKIGIIVSGASYFHTMEALDILELNLPVLKLGFFYPLPEVKIKNFIKDFKKVLIVEETEGHIEKEIFALAKNVNHKMEIFGKKSVPLALPEIGELNTEKIVVVLSKILKLKIENPSKTQNLGAEIPRRTARLCEGCPYWYIFPVLKRVAPEAIFTGDIGCNMIAGLDPHNIQDTLFSMGASLGLAHGIKKNTKQKVISIMGDGTFFHSGMAGLVNAVYNKSNPLVVVLDNRITAMTGHQVNPGMGKTLMGEGTEELRIEKIAEAFGVKHIKVLDPKNMQELENTVKEFLDKDEISLIICKRICALLARRQDSDKHEQ